MYIRSMMRISKKMYIILFVLCLAINVFASDSLYVYVASPIPNGLNCDTGSSYLGKISNKKIEKIYNSIFINSNTDFMVSDYESGLLVVASSIKCTEEYGDGYCVQEINMHNPEVLNKKYIESQGMKIVSPVIIDYGNGAETSIMLNGIRTKNGNIAIASIKPDGTNRTSYGLDAMVGLKNGGYFGPNVISGVYSYGVIEDNAFFFKFYSFSSGKFINVPEYMANIGGIISVPISNSKAVIIESEIKDTNVPYVKTKEYYLYSKASNKWKMLQLSGELVTLKAFGDYFVSISQTNSSVKKYRETSEGNFIEENKCETYPSYEELENYTGIINSGNYTIYDYDGNKKASIKTQKDSDILYVESDIVYLRVGREIIKYKIFNDILQFGESLIDGSNDDVRRIHYAFPLYE